MKIALHMAVTLALLLTLVSGLCVGCVEAGGEHKCCRETEQTPSCHQPQPSEQERCDCPDTGRILASAAEAKQAGKQTVQPLAVLAVLDIQGTDAIGSTLALQTRTEILPPQDILSLNSILRI